MNIEALEARLRSTLSQRFLPLGVIAVAGTTEDGAVDPAHHIVTLRERLASELGESFWLHIDAAWLYSIAIVSADQVAVSDFVSREWTLQQGRYTKHLSLKWGSPDVLAAFECFPQAESVAIDPHKMGYIPYPCGAVAFKNDLVRQFSNQEIAYISSRTSRTLTSGTTKHQTRSARTFWKAPNLERASQLAGSRIA